MDKHYPFLHNSWLYLLFYYTFHHEGLYYDYIKYFFFYLNLFHARFNNIIIVRMYPRNYHSIIFPLNI